MNNNKICINQREFDILLSRALYNCQSITNTIGNKYTAYVLLSKQFNNYKYLLECFNENIYVFQYDPNWTEQQFQDEFKYSLTFIDKNSIRLCGWIYENILRSEFYIPINNNYKKLITDININNYIYKNWNDIANIIQQLKPFMVNNRIDLISCNLSRTNKSLKDFKMTLKQYLDIDIANSFYKINSNWILDSNNFNLIGPLSYFNKKIELLNSLEIYKIEEYSWKGFTDALGRTFGAGLQAQAKGQTDMYRDVIKNTKIDWDEVGRFCKGALTVVGDAYVANAEMQMDVGSTEVLELLAQFDVTGLVSLALNIKKMSLEIVKYKKIKKPKTSDTIRLVFCCLAVLLDVVFFMIPDIPFSKKFTKQGLNNVLKKIFDVLLTNLTSSLLSTVLDSTGTTLISIVNLCKDKDYLDVKQILGYHTKSMKNYIDNNKNKSK